MESDIECYQSTTEMQLRNSASTVETHSSKNTNEVKISTGMFKEITVVTGVIIFAAFFF